jgi:putative ABC transport system permease protein
MRRGFALVSKFARRDWRAGELRLLGTALVLAVGSVTGISLFVDRLSGALLSESATYLAADRVIASTRPTADAVAAQATSLGLGVARTMSFPSMLFASARNQLVSVKAVSDGYPLRGRLRVADAPFGSSRATYALPAPGTVWLDSRLFPALGIRIGDTVSVGVADFSVSGVLIDEPDRGGGLLDFGPRLLMRIDDVPATQVVQPGSRIFYRLLLAGDAAALAAFEHTVAGQLGAGFRLLGIRDAGGSIAATLDRAEAFLSLGGLLAVLLAGLAVALAAQRYVRRHYDHVAILKTFGTTPAEILWGYLGLLGLVGVLATLVGLALGVLLHVAIVAALSSFLPLALPWPGARAFVSGAVTGFVCLAAFALPPVLALQGISPLRVLKRELADVAVPRRLSYSCAAAGGLALLVWYSGDWRMTLWVVAAVGSASVVFGCLARGLLAAGRRLGMQARSSVRLALAGLARRRDETVAQLLIFGLAIMLLLVLVVLRSSLIGEWQRELPAETPNQFLMNVAPDQVEPLRALLAPHVATMQELYPMTRGRVVAVNGIPEGQRARAPRDGAEPRLDAERNLSWTARLPANNRIVAGSWWAAGGTAAEVSLEEQYAAAADVELGDVLDFDIGGLPVTARVTSIRRVEWDSLAPNFFILFSPGAVPDVAATYMTSFYLPAADKAFLNELLARFPTVTVIEVDRLIAQVQSIIARVSRAVELVLALVLVAGCLVLVASIQASRDERLREHALLRALGATRQLIGNALAIEFVLLGAAAGLLAAIGTETTVWALCLHVFDLPVRLHGWVWLAGPGLGALIVGAVGVSGTRALLRSPPMWVLRELA